MPILQFSDAEVHNFEMQFQLEVQRRTNLVFATLFEAYVAYQSLADNRRQRFWEAVSMAAQMPRERAYKFFRFTWSRRFYTPIDEFREPIRALVFQTLREMHATQKGSEVNHAVWARIWDSFKDYNLHYDALDQHCRNCSNMYFAKLAQGKAVEIPSAGPLPSKPLETIADKISKLHALVGKRAQENVTKHPASPVDTYVYFGKDEETNQGIYLGPREPQCSEQYESPTPGAESFEGFFQDHSIPQLLLDLLEGE